MADTGRPYRSDNTRASEGIFGGNGRSKSFGTYQYQSNSQVLGMKGDLHSGRRPDRRIDRTTYASPNHTPAFNSYTDTDVSPEATVFGAMGGSDSLATPTLSQGHNTS